MLTTLHFVGAVNNTWDLTTANWSDGASNVAWQNGDTAVFDGTAATVTIAPGAAISAAEIDFTTGGYNITTGTGGSLAVTGSGTIDVASGISDTISAPLVGSNGLMLPDSGALLLSAANSFTGATVIDAGILQLGNASALGSSTSVSAFAAGTLDLNGQAVGSAVSLDDFAGTITNSDTGVAASFGATINATTQDSFTISGSGDVTLGGTVYGSSAITLTKSGGNTLTVSDASEFDRLSLDIDDGNVVQSGGATYTTLDISAGSIMTIAPSGPGTVLTTLDWDPGHTGSTTGPSGGTGAWDTSTANWYNAATGEDQTWSDAGTDVAVFSGAAGTVTLDSGISANAVSLQTDGYLLQDGTLSAAQNGGFVVADGLTATIDSAIVGSTAVSKNGAGDLVLGGSNTYTGPTSINDGMLALAGSTALGDSSGLTCSAGATLDLDGQAIDDSVPINLFEGTLTNSSDTAASFAGSINADTFGFGFNFTVSGTGDITLSGSVDNYGSTLTKTGDNTLTLSGSTNNVGLYVTVDGGTLVLDKASSGRVQAIQDGLTLNGGTVELSGTGGNQLDYSPIDAGRSGGTLDLNGRDDTADSLNGHGDLSITGSGILTLDDISSNIGTVTIGAGATLVADACMATSATADFVVDGTLDLSGYDQSVSSLAGSGTVTNSVADTTTILTVGADNSSTTFSGTIEDGSGAVGLTITGSGEQIFTGESIYSGGTIIDGGTLQLGDGATANGSVGGDITDDGTLIFANISNQSYSGVISGTGGVNVAGSATVTLSGDSTYSGSTTVGSGVLQAGGNNALSAASAFVVDGTLDVDGYNETIESLAGAGTVTNTLASSTSTLTVGSGNADGAFAGILQDTGSGGTAGVVALAKTGTGTQILGGENTYSGGTAIDAGTLQLGDGFSSNGSVVGNISDDGSLVFAEIYAQTYAGVISGTGTVAQNGYNALTLTGASTYTGATSVNAGILILGAGGSLGNTAISVAGGAAFDPQPGSGTVSAGGTGSGSAGATLALAPDRRSA